MGAHTCVKRPSLGLGLVNYYSVSQWPTFELLGITKRLGGGFKHFLFSPLPGEMIQFDEYFFRWVGSTTNQKNMFNREKNSSGSNLQTFHGPKWVSEPFGLPGDSSYLFMTPSLRASPKKVTSFPWLVNLPPQHLPRQK